VGNCLYLQVFLLLLVAVFCVAAALLDPGRYGGYHHSGYGRGYGGHGGRYGYGHGHGGGHRGYGHGRGHYGHH